jgi:hypothetical protein
VTLHRLAERLGAAALAGAERRPVSAPVIAAATRAVFDEAPGVFAPDRDEIHRTLGNLSLATGQTEHATSDVQLLTILEQGHHGEYR